MASCGECSVNWFCTRLYRNSLHRDATDRAQQQWPGARPPSLDVGSGKEHTEGPLDWQSPSLEVLTFTVMSDKTGGHMQTNTLTDTDCKNETGIDKNWKVSKTKVLKLVFLLKSIKSV